ncbi:MAG: hypothetical protein AB7T19_18135 [Planctomycetota bacterium]
MIVLTLALLGVAGCGKEPADTPEPAEPASEPTIEHDFGIVPHGETRDARLAIPLPAGGPWTPLTLQRSCTCVRPRFAIESADGSIRYTSGDGRPDPNGAVKDGERLFLELTLDTREKEVADLAPSWTPAQVVLSGPNLTQGFVRIRFQFGIEAPVRLSPSAQFALGELPRPVRYRQQMEIHRRGKQIAFGMPTVVEANTDGMLTNPSDVAVTLDGTAEPAILEVAVKPGELRPLGAFRCEIRIPTDRPDGYVIHVPVSGQVIDAVHVEPPGVYSFGRIDFAEPREMRLRVVDHDPTRSPDFVVISVTGDDGRDLREHFGVTVESLSGRPRERVIALSYRGTLRETSFRGTVELAKAADQPALLRIPFSAYARR